MEPLAPRKLDRNAVRSPRTNGGRNVLKTASTGSGGAVPAASFLSSSYRRSRVAIGFGVMRDTEKGTDPVPNQAGIDADHSA